MPTGYQLVNIYDTLKRYKLYTNDYDLYRRIINIKRVTIEHIVCEITSRLKEELSKEAPQTKEAKKALREKKKQIKEIEKKAV